MKDNGLRPRPFRTNWRWCASYFPLLDVGGGDAAPYIKCKKLTKPAFLHIRHLAINRVWALYLDLWAPFIKYSQNERCRVNLPESVMSESLDEIIRRSAIRLEQERLHVAELRAGDSQHASAKATLANGMQALDKLKKYRARFDNVER